MVTLQQMEPDSPSRPVQSNPWKGAGAQRIWVTPLETRGQVWGPGKERTFGSTDMDHFHMEIFLTY